MAENPLDNFGRDVSILDDLIIAFGAAEGRIKDALKVTNQNNPEHAATRRRLEAQLLRVREGWKAMQANHTMDVTYMDDAERGAYVASAVAANRRQS